MSPNPYLILELKGAALIAGYFKEGGIIHIKFYEFVIFSF